MSFLWWHPVDIWEKRRTSFSFLLQTGCLSSGNLSEGRRRRAVWKWGALFQTWPLLTCSFSEQWKGKNWFCPLPDTLTISQTLQCLPALLFSSLSLWRTSSPLRWVFQDTPQTGAGFGTRKASDPRFCLFFPTIIGNLLPHPNSHKLTGQINVVFLLLWQCQFYGNRWQRAQGCGAQLVCQNAMETFSAGIRLSTSSSSTQSEQANSSNAFWLHCRCSIDTT